MLKKTLFSLLTLGAAAMSGSDLFAGATINCAQAASCAANCCAACGCSASAGLLTEAKTPADAQTGLNKSQPNPTASYQSYSYEPSSSRPAAFARSQPVNRAATKQSSSWYYDTVRGDKKVRGF